ncbi:hypothetical protein GZ77_05420 [Endozoicomonas montiporae]|uniref:Uncharacterized protein n=2 Tax=Endozoicomonas montiporae TaxID=1027273 RepID=A0A081NBV6_9GAMM|nr:hypothetical protein [Endozoicomonas montiporae]AMO56246.1 hypothetical protein EZMO1_2134 [Endozoicomonas montiporae CL-33]KEQ15929.1 hypothetical protein GZ77_05420 [Endozoicomonas montiporae]
MTIRWNVYFLHFVRTLRNLDIYMGTLLVMGTILGWYEFNTRSLVVTVSLLLLSYLFAVGCVSDNSEKDCVPPWRLLGVSFSL